MEAQIKDGRCGSGPNDAASAVEFRVWVANWQRSGSSGPLGTVSRSISSSATWRKVLAGEGSVFAFSLANSTTPFSAYNHVGRPIFIRTCRV
jgi:hypothetical protein